MTTERQVGEHARAAVVARGDIDWQAVVGFLESSMAEVDPSADGADTAATAARLLRQMALVWQRQGELEVASALLQASDALSRGDAAATEVPAPLRHLARG